VATAAFDATDTRTRILQTAQRLLRKRGYHAPGLNEIPEMAQPPRGSMYHQFPAGKAGVGVCVIENISMLEGGSLLAQVRQDAGLFRDAVKQAAQICSVGEN